MMQPEFTIHCIHCYPSISVGATAVIVAPKDNLPQAAIALPQTSWRKVYWPRMTCLEITTYG